MLAGHYAPSLVAASTRRDVPLWLLLLAGQAVDVGFNALCAVGVERFRIVPGANASNPLVLDFMPYMHSLAATIVWAVVCGAVVGIALRRAAAGVVTGVVVASHWLLDLVVHVPDLPLAAGDGPKVGFGLWNAPHVALAVELAVVVAAYALYAARTTAPAGRVRALGVVLVLLTFGAFYAPIPTTPAALVAMQLGGYAAVVGLGVFVERR